MILGETGDICKLLVLEAVSMIQVIGILELTRACRTCLNLEPYFTTVGAESM